MKIPILCFLLLFAVSSQAATTYYIDFTAGSDSNAGTSKSAPKKNHPYMKAYSGSYTHASGDRFIFKGGVTWPGTCFPLNVPVGGSAVANDYYGVDTSWFNGTAWSRPILDVAYSTNVGISIDGCQYVTIDGLEIMRVQASSADSGALIHGDNNTAYVLMTNLYLHGWRVTGSTDGAHGGAIFSHYSDTQTNVVLENSELTNLENAGNLTQNGLAIRHIGTIRGCLIHDVSSAILFTGNVHDNHIYNVCYPSSNSGYDGVYHLNGIYLDNGGMGTTYYCYNNRIHDVGGGANMIYPNPAGKIQYVYNNLLYGVMSSQLAIQIDPYNYGSGGSTGAVYVYNNTIVNYFSGTPGIHITDRGGSPILATLVARNNHIIGINASVHDGSVGTVTSAISTDNLVQTPDVAASLGYTLANLYAPTTSSSPTVNAGNPEPATLFAFDITGATNRPQGAAWDIGAYEFGGPPAPPTNARVTITAQ